ncbi:MAG: DUF11 domain-containing protein [Acidobacteriota bacterium]|nr:DUF11 domain-containing protein [Acidobacteriota bacterium]MDH3785086.1 DUF11 domain-containing protein [Acidobacteriota bacterium]
MDSNVVVTMVLGTHCFESPQIGVIPQGTVAPAELLTFTVAITNDNSLDLNDVTVRTPLDVGLLAPISFSTMTVTTANGGSAEVTGVYDPMSRTLTWTVDQITAGDSIELEFQAEVQSGLVPDSTIAKQAEVSSLACPVPISTNVLVIGIVPPVLQLTKSANRSSATVGDSVIYSLVAAHSGTVLDLDNTVVVDRLPPTLRYLRGSTTIDGVSAPDPITAEKGRLLTFGLGLLQPGDGRLVRYATVVAAGAVRGEAINQAHLEAMTPAGSLVVSDQATAAVRLTPGPFRREAQLVGRVFVDDDSDGVPDDGEPGVPGALVTMEDGRGALTDVSGRWSITGVDPGLHVVRIDPATLPSSIIPTIGGTQWVGDAGTRFVEARASTLVIADLPVGPPLSPRCSITAEPISYTLPLAIFQDSRGRYDSAADRHLQALARLVDDAGVSSDRSMAVKCGDDSVRQRMAREISAALNVVRRIRDSRPEENRPKSFEQTLRTVKPVAQILSPLEGDVADRTRIDIDVIVPTESGSELRVNGGLVPERRVGTRSELPSRGLIAMRYVGVELRPGDNVIELNSGAAVIHVSLPDEPVELVASAEGGHWVADGVTTPVLIVETLDQFGARSLARQTLTLEIEGATVAEDDLDLERSGLQVRIVRGVAKVAMSPQTSPGRVRVRASTDLMEIEEEIEVHPGGGGWRITGLAEANLVGDGGVEGDGGAAPGLGDPITESGGRVALFARGPLGDKAQLTVSVDTERERDRDRLTNDFEPDLFYPVVGDESVAIDEAASQGKVFVRVDGTRGYAQWGDFSTAFRRTELGRYDRKLTGARGNVSKGGFSFDGFASSSDQQVVRDVFEADNTSGPFILRSSPVVARSETVIVETRDRFHTDEVISREIKRADLDYDLDPVAGTILFRGPIAAFDAALNPRRVVVLYESRGGGEDQWTGGGRVAWRSGRNFEIGSTAVVEERSGENYSLLGMDLHWRLSPGTQLHAEVASSDAGEQSTAYRLHLSGAPRHQLRWEFGFEDVPQAFDNPTLLAAPEVGSRRIRGQIEWQPTDDWRIKAEGYTQEDEGAGIDRTVLGVEAERRAGPVTALGGLRHVSAETGAGPETDSTLIKAGLRGKISDRWSAEFHREQALSGETAPGFPTRTAVGVSFDVRTDTKIFLREEIESGDGPDRDRTVLGVESQIGPHTRGLMNYSLNGGVQGDSLRALAGVETVLPLDERRSLQFSAGRLQTTLGDDTGDYTTLGAGFEYRTGSKLLSTRYELRLGELDDRHLLTATGAFKPSEPWTIFVRERLFVDARDGIDTSWRGEGLLGTAYRPLAGRWQFLTRLDHQIGNGVAGTSAGVLPGTAPTEPSSSIGTPSPSTIGIGLGTDPGRGYPDTDVISISVAAGFRPTAKHRVASSVIVRHVGEDETLNIPSTLARLVSLHYTTQVHQRWTLGMSLREFAELRSSTRDSGAGVEVGFLAFRNLWITVGYNVIGFDDGDFSAAETTESGAFVSFRFKFDERSLTRLGDLRLDR